MEDQDLNESRPLHDILTRVAEGESTALKVADTLDGKGKALVIESRKLLPEAPRMPQKAETPPRAHNFYEVQGTVDYLRKYGGENTVLFADPRAGRVEIVLNDKEAAGGFEQLTFAPMLHPKWEPWEALLGKKIPLALFVDFLTQNRRAIVDPDGRELVMALSQVKASTSIELQQGRGKKSLNGLMVRVEIQGTKSDEIVELPEVLTLNVPIYVGTEPRKLELDLTIEAVSGGTAIVVHVASSALMDAKVAAFDEMLDAFEPLKAEKKLTVTLGAPEYGSYTYLK